MEKNIIIYDSLCTYCRKFKYLVSKLDRKKIFLFLPFSSKLAKNILRKQFGEHYKFALYLIHKNTVYCGKEATKKIFSILKTPILKHKYIHHLYLPTANLISIITKRKQKVIALKTKSELKLEVKNLIEEL